MDKQDDSEIDNLYQQLTELRKANEDCVRLKNVEKFTAAGRLMRTIAHEIRNPLTNISLALEQLNSEIPKDGDSGLLLEMINRNTSRINGLISELLESTKFAQLQFAHISINELLDEVIEQVHHFAEQKNVTIEEEFTDSLPVLVADTEKMKMAFENILTYCIESVQPTSGKVEITTAGENSKCIVTVKSNGASISGEKIERLFDPYFISKGGSGLALTQAQNIILNHGGNVYVESEPGKGTIFTIILDFA